jgi:hypothetical protein
VNYQRIPDTEIAWVKFPGSAFREAQRDYAAYSGIDFADDLLDYLENAFVVSRPNLFAMARPIEFRGKRGWFIRFARGNLLELLTVLPCPLEFVAFVRNNDKTIRIVNWEWFVKKTLARRKYGSAFSQE